MKEMLRGPSLVYHLVKRLKERYPDKQIGKTIIQKLFFLIETKSESDLDFDYTMYHYGPYSSQIGEYISLAEALDFINVKWTSEKGYFIEPLDPPKELLLDIKDLQNLLNIKKLQDLLEEVVDNYGKFTANELSIIATAIYIKKRFGIKSREELIDVVLKIKPNNKRDWIRSVLIKGKVIGK